MAKRILLVDDEPLILKGLKFSLEQDGYETDSAADGEEALNKFFAGRYDLVLLDVMLPKIDGIDVCLRIREKSSVPIIWHSRCVPSMAPTSRQTVSAQVTFGERSRGFRRWRREGLFS